MSSSGQDVTPRERELGAIIHAYNEVTERLKESHEQLRAEVQRLHQELTQKNRQLRRRERLAALGEMAAGVAHEIRNPLGGIQMFACLLKRDLADRPEAVRLVEKINKGVNTLESIVSNILAFSRPAEPQPARVRMKVLVAEALDLAASRTAASGVRVEVANSLAELECETDAKLLQRALLNILLNAIDAAGEAGRADGRVLVSARLDSGERVTLSVADNGSGIAPELMDRVFNPFFTTKGSGTGLGLSIVHQIVESLGGSIQAANQRGGGAVFSISLPQRWAEDRGKAKGAPRDPASRKTRRAVSSLQERTTVRNQEVA